VCWGHYSEYVSIRSVHFYRKKGWDREENLGGGGRWGRNSRQRGDEVRKGFSLTVQIRNQGRTCDKGPEEGKSPRRVLSKRKWIGEKR